MFRDPQQPDAPSFQPAISRKSRRVASALAPLAERQFEEQDKKRERLEALVQRVDEERNAGATYTPRLSKAPQYLDVGGRVPLSERPLPQRSVERPPDPEETFRPKTNYNGGLHAGASSSSPFPSSSSPQTVSAALTVANASAQPHQSDAALDSQAKRQARELWRDYADGPSMSARGILNVLRTFGITEESRPDLVAKFLAAMGVDAAARSEASRYVAYDRFLKVMTTVVRAALPSAAAAPPPSHPQRIIQPRASSVPQQQQQQYQQYRSSSSASNGRAPSHSHPLSHSSSPSAHHAYHHDPNAHQHQHRHLGVDNSAAVRRRPQSARPVSARTVVSAIPPASASTPSPQQHHHQQRGGSASGSRGGASQQKQQQRRGIGGGGSVFNIGTADDSSDSSDAEEVSAAVADGSAHRNNGAFATPSYFSSSSPNRPVFGSDGRFVVNDGGRSTAAADADHSPSPSHGVGQNLAEEAFSPAPQNPAEQQRAATYASQFEQQQRLNGPQPSLSSPARPSRSQHQSQPRPVMTPAALSAAVAQRREAEGGLQGRPRMSDKAAARQRAIAEEAAERERAACSFQPRTLGGIDPHVAALLGAARARSEASLKARDEASGRKKSTSVVRRAPSRGGVGAAAEKTVLSSSSASRGRAWSEGANNDAEGADGGYGNGLSPSPQQAEAHSRRASRSQSRPQSSVSGGDVNVIFMPKDPPGFDKVVQRLAEGRARAVPKFEDALRSAASQRPSAAALHTNGHAMAEEGASSSAVPAEPTEPRPFAFASEAREKERAQRRPLLFVDVNLPHGKSGRIGVYSGDDPETLAHNFCVTYGLDTDALAQLTAMLRQRIDMTLRANAIKKVWA